MSAAVLLAEPEPQFRDLLEHQLSVAGFAVVGAGAGAEALTLAEQAAPISSWSGTSCPTPPRRSFAGAARGRAGQELEPRGAVIVLGGAESDAVERVQAFERGCDDYLTQPFHHQELVGSIAHFSESPIARRSRIFSETAICDSPNTR